MNEAPPQKPESPSNEPAKREVPERFLVSRRTLLADRFMTHLIRVGGLAITVAVFGIFIFIAAEIIPLFKGAEVYEDGAAEVGGSKAVVLASDEWGEYPMIYEGGSSVRFIDLVGDREDLEVPLNLPADFEISSINYRPLQGHLILGSSDGRIAISVVKFEGKFMDGGRTVFGEVEDPVIFEKPKAEVPAAADSAVADAASADPDAVAAPAAAPVAPGVRIMKADLGAGSNRGILAFFEESEGDAHLHALSFTRRRGLGAVGGSGPAELNFEADFDLSDTFEGTAKFIRASSVGDNFIAVNEKGEVFYYSVEGRELGLRQNFMPFEDLEDPRIGSIDFMIGEVTFVATSYSGVVRAFSLYRPDDAPRRLWGQTKEFVPLQGGQAEFFLSSPRNKSFFFGREGQARLTNLTAEADRWQGEVPADIVALALDGKGEAALILDEEGVLHHLHIHDRHPSSSVRAYFGRVWYEGRNRPEYLWQSTGGTDDFESKLSMVPLIIGTLKGTLYALLFAVPIAFLSAVYVAAFVSPKAKKIIKPTMEIMASLPSVVLGFLAGLVLAPFLDGRVPSFLAAIVVLPISAVLFGYMWGKLPVQARAWLRPGWEWLLVLPISGLCGYLAWQTGPFLEQALFFVRDAEGQKVADFRMWWPEFTGTGYDQRNCLVVGFMMGFAVIPIIFTISEDSLSAVPPGLLAASDALGASRWQTVRNIMIPIATAGMFSALMIGFGRAVGETMIVLMATGNTPVLEWNIFTGMRTLAANIAVELPEAPVGSTHYRALFLGALILFIMTFAVNTVAEVLRQRLREKFKIV